MLKRAINRTPTMSRSDSDKIHQKGTIFRAFFVTGLYNIQMTTMTHHEREHNFCVNQWLRRKGIDQRTIDRHPKVSDIQLLLDFRAEFEDELGTDRSAMATWGALWNVSFVMQKPIKAKYWLKLERIHQRCLAIRQRTDNIKARIRALRHTGTSQVENKGHDMTAKGPNLPGVKHMKREQEGGRGVLDTLPWE